MTDVNTEPMKTWTRWEIKNIEINTHTPQMRYVKMKLVPLQDFHALVGESFWQQFLCWFSCFAPPGWNGLHIGCSTSLVMTPPHPAHTITWHRAIMNQSALPSFCFSDYWWEWGGWSFGWSVGRRDGQTFQNSSSTIQWETGIHLVNLFT